MPKNDMKLLLYLFKSRTITPTIQIDKYDNDNNNNRLLFCTISNGVGGGLANVSHTVYKESSVANTMLQPPIITPTRHYGIARI